MQTSLWRIFGGVPRHWLLLAVSFCLCLFQTALRAQTLVNFEQFASAPSLFSSANPPLRIGSATFAGGQVLNAATFLPANPSVVYGTAHFCSGCAPTLVIDFDKPVSDFSMLLMNGWVVTVTYTVQDDKGGIQTLTLPPNLSSGAQTVSLPSTGIRRVNISGSAGSSWDFFIDNVRFKDGRDYNIELSNFIPHDHVIGPPQSRCGRGNQIYFSGDNRSFSPSAPTYRSKQTVTVNVTDGVKSGTSPENLVGLTKAYAADALNDGVINASDDDGTLGDCRLLHEVGRASNSGMSVNVQRLSDTSVEVRLLGGGVGNPLVTGAPATDWVLTIVIDEAASTWTIVGEHDGFPAFEVYLNEQPIYTYSPGVPPYSFLSDVIKLFPPMDVTANRSGTLPN